MVRQRDENDALALIAGKNLEFSDAGFKHTVFAQPVVNLKTS